MKLIVQIPCFNEEKTLPLVLTSIPKKIEGIDEIETLIIDDGSSDNTVGVAKKYGVHHIVIHPQNKGLARAFANGISEALRYDADIIVNTDADNQYYQQDIPKLIRPILEGNADIVIGDRQTSTITHFSKAKKGFQRLGSATVRFLSGTKVPDAVSGFRAYSREAALHLNIITDFSYAIETIIQAKYKRLSITSVKIRTNDPTRKSRLFKNTFQHMRQSAATLLRVYTMYQPFRVFFAIGLLLFFTGFLLAGRFIFFFLLGQGTGHVQSLILSAVLMLIGFQVVLTGLLADLMGINRKLLEENLKRVKQVELRQQKGISVPAKYSPHSYTVN
ncbi:MAG: glycosyltransferase family 2 protein [bacterium]|nr:glycosyltransferase family 2 protein [bacterium]